MPATTNLINTLPLATPLCAPSSTCRCQSAAISLCLYLPHFPLFLPLFLYLSPLPITTSSCSPAAHPVLSFPPFQNTSSSTFSPLSFSLPLPPSLRLCLALNLLRPRTLPAVWRRLGSISQQKLEHVPAADSRLILQQQHQLQLIVAFNANNLAQLATCETQSKEAVRRRIGRPLGDCSKCRGSRRESEGLQGAAWSGHYLLAMRCSPRCL